jgi:hypothetical protein
MAFNNGDRKWPIVWTNVQFCTPVHLLINCVLLVVQGKEVLNLAPIAIWAFEFDNVVGLWTKDGAPISLVVLAQGRDKRICRFIGGREATLEFVGAC